MPQDKRLEENLPVPYVEEGKDMMIPLTKALVLAFEDAFIKIEQLTNNIDLNNLPQEDLSVFTQMDIVLLSYKKQNQSEVFQSDSYFDQRELAKTAVSAINQLIEDLPGWIPVLFEGYGEKFAQLSRQKIIPFVMLMKASEVNKYFEKQGTHDFIIDCLTLSRNEAWTVKKQMGNATVRLLNIEGILGDQLEKYHSALSIDERLDILKNAVRQATVRQRHIEPQSGQRLLNQT